MKVWVLKQQDTLAPYTLYRLTFTGNIDTGNLDQWPFPEQIASSRENVFSMEIQMTMVLIPNFTGKSLYSETCLERPLP